MKPEFAAIGLGNLYMGDDAAGVMVVNALSARASEFPGVAFIDCGTGGFAVLHAIAGRRGVVFVDCARMGLEPGAIRRFAPGEALPAGVTSRSSHALDLDALIELSKTAGECPSSMAVLGIEPLSTEPGQGLSNPLRAHFDDYVSVLAAELRRMIGG